MNKKNDTICLVNYADQDFNIHASFPLGMAHVAGAIKEANYKYVVLDLDMDKNLVDEINNYDYIMFGMRAGNALNLVLDKIEEIKTNTPEKTIVIGGPLVMAMPGKVLKDTKADYLIHGDAEEAVINLLVALENKSDLSKIKGVGYKKMELFLSMNPH